MGRVHGPELWEGIAIQAGWVIVMCLSATTLWRLGLRKYQAVGV
jgi:ABC-type uncharacterized transport system permease subunit